jgi:hypothetical protein
MKKPTKTASELEAMIRLEMEEICAWPTDLMVSVKPDADTWKAEITGVRTSSQEDLCEVLRLIADRFRIEYDLAS